MDIKERALLIDVLDRVRALDFTERDVLTLFILLRRHTTPATSLIQELGDFVAHRERDRGLLLSFLKRVQQALLPGAVPPEFFDAPVSLTALHAQFERLLAGLQLTSLGHAQIEALTVLSSTLLHGVQFSVPGGPPWSLQFGFNTRFVGLFGVVPVGGALITLPIMATRNRFFASPYPTPDTYWFPSPGFAVSSTCSQGSVGFSQAPAA